MIDGAGPLRVARRVGGGLLLLACLARCTPPSDPVSAPTAETELPPPPSTPPPTAIDAPAAGSSSDAGSVASPPTSDPAHFECGKTPCKSGEQTCCGAGKEGVCLPSSPDDGPVGSVGYLKTQWEACDGAAAGLGVSMSHIDRCDESVDCDDGAICCEQFLFSGGSMSECVAAPKDGKTPCEFGERCLDGSPCRMPGTRCIDGFCLAPVSNLRCGAGPCADGEVCCGDPPGCVANGACGVFSRIRCTRHDECVSGQSCIASGRGTVCTGIVLNGGQGPLCQRDADCTMSCLAGGAPRCVPYSVPWLKSCECP